jgi:ribosome-associated toxin RatA of RatAB toxin-antitoxin module
MPTVSTRTEITNARIQTVWNIVRDVERYPSLANHVLEVSPDGPHHRWAVLLNGSRVEWVQRDWWKPPSRAGFDQVSGDFDRLRGGWWLERRGSGAVLRLRIDLHLGVDGLAPLLDPVWAQSFQAHADALLSAIAGAAGEPAVPGSQAEMRTS